MSVAPPYDYDDIAVNSLKKTLLGMAGITALVTNVFWEAVPTDDISMPYVTIHYISGGWEKDEMVANVAKVWYKVQIHTTNLGLARDFKKALSALHNKDLDVSNFTNVKPYDKIFKNVHIFDKDPAQNIPVFRVGGIYELSFVVNDII